MTLSIFLRASPFAASVVIWADPIPLPFYNGVDSLTLRPKEYHSNVVDSTNMYRRLLTWNRLRDRLNLGARDLGASIRIVVAKCRSINSTRVRSCNNMTNVTRNLTKGIRDLMRS